jgi:hypothetical protein
VFFFNLGMQKFFLGMQKTFLGVQTITSTPLELDYHEHFPLRQAKPKTFLVDQK